MPFRQTLTTSAILNAFNDTITARGGRIIDKLDDDGRLFARSVLPAIQEVRPGDKHQGGVALRATADEVWVHPYLFRQVCTNGAIMGQTVQTRHLENLTSTNASDAILQIQEATAACCEPDAFMQSIQHLRSACETQADLALTFMSMTGRLRGNSPLLKTIMDMVFNDRDHSQFGLINAITAVARDTRDPQTRWDMEEFAGNLSLQKQPDPAKAARQSKREPRAAALSAC